MLYLPSLGANKGKERREKGKKIITCKCILAIDTTGVYELDQLKVQML